MKKLIAVLGAVTICLTAFSGCGAKDDVSVTEANGQTAISTEENTQGKTEITKSTDGTSKSSTTAKSVTTSKKTTEKANSEVKIVIPAYYYSGINTASSGLSQEEKNEGYISKTVNSDGSVTYIIKKNKLGSIKSEMKNTVKTQINDTVNTLSSFLKSDSNSDFSEIKIYVDKASYQNGYDNLSLPGIYYVAGFYQALCEKTVKCKFLMIDNITGETVDTVVFP